MKDLIYKVLHIPAEKISDKTLMKRVYSTVIIISVLLFGMGISAYAYFSSDVASHSNKIKSAEFTIDIAVDGVAAGNQTTIQDNDPHYFSLHYTGTAETGYCKIVISNGTDSENYFTTQFVKNSNENIQVSITAKPGFTVRIIPNWGVSAIYAQDNNSASLLNDGDIIVTQLD